MTREKVAGPRKMELGYAIAGKNSFDVAPHSTFMNAEVSWCTVEWKYETIGNNDLEAL